VPENILTTYNQCSVNCGGRTV